MTLDGRYHSDWYDYVKAPVKEWEYNNEEFMLFFNKFSKMISGSSILLIGTGSTELMFTEWPSIFKRHGAISITYLEICEEYCNRFSNREYKIIKGDVIDIDKYISKGTFDLICWFHGPEHIHRDKMPPTFGKIKQLANKGLVTICPFGSYYDNAPQQANVYENHLQPNMSVSDFDEVSGVFFFSVGIKDTSDAVIFGYYFKEELDG